MESYLDRTDAFNTIGSQFFELLLHKSTGKEAYDNKEAVQACRESYDATSLSIGKTKHMLVPIKSHTTTV